MSGGNSVAPRERVAEVAESGSLSLGSAVCVVFSPYLYRCYCSLCLLFC